MLYFFRELETQKNQFSSIVSRQLLLIYNFIDIIVVILILFIFRMEVLISVYIKSIVINHRKEKILLNENYYLQKQFEENTREKYQLIISISQVSKSREASAVSLSNRRLICIRKLSCDQKLLFVLASCRHVTIGCFTWCIRSCIDRGWTCRHSLQA